MKTVLLTLLFLTSGRAVNKTEVVLENIKQVLDEKFQGNVTGTSGRRLLASRLQDFLPPFAITSGKVNEKCQADSRTFLEHLDNLEMWALKMHDSSGKLPSGLLNGNVNQFGDFDQCLSIDEAQIGIQGRYCLAYVHLKLGQDAEDSSQLKDVLDLIHSHSAFRSQLSDPGHRVPRFSTTNWALCVPHSCTAQDVEIHLKKTVEEHSNGTGFEVEVRVDNEMCQLKGSWNLSLSFIIVSCFLLSFLAVAVVATAKELLLGQDDSLLNCFSLKRNVLQLFSLKRPSDDIASLHGIRFINAIMLVVSHKSMAIFFNPYTNRTYMTEHLVQPWSVLARAASLYTDPFIMISGILTAYSFVRTMRTKKRLDLWSEFLSRYLRIVPLLAVIVLLSTFVLPELGSGPQWNLTVTSHANKCKDTWWRNFLFIHNYFGFENMCLTHTHHVGIDTQLFLISPILVVCLYKWPMLGLSGLTALAAVSTALRYSVTQAKQLSYFIYSGSSIRQMLNTANFSYILPTHRLTVYIIGILLGYFLQTIGRDYKLKPHMRRIGWTVALTLLYYSIAKPISLGRRGYVYDEQEAAEYAALAPIAWCSFFAWIIFMDHIGHGGLPGLILSSKYFLIWTRASYAVYLSQFPIFFMNVGLQRSSQEYSFFSLLNLYEFVSIFCATVVLTLLFDLPFNNMKRLLLRK